MNKDAAATTAVDDMYIVSKKADQDIQVNRASNAWGYERERSLVDSGC